MQRPLIAFVLGLLVVCTSAGTARAWVENHLLGDEVLLTVDASGKALVEHRLELEVNGNERQHRFKLAGVDRDAVPLGDCYLVPAGDALSSSLDSAIPLRLALRARHPRRTAEQQSRTDLAISVDDRKGLWRGTFVLVLRYRTDLRSRGLVERDGAMVRLRWQGPVYHDGFDNARVTFVVPAAPTPPRAVAALGADADEPEHDSDGAYLSEVRRGGEQDEVELLRTYLPVGEPAEWVIRVDPRAVSAPAVQTSQTSHGVERRSLRGLASQPQERQQLAAIVLFVLITALVWLKGRTVERRAADAHAVMAPLVPLPTALRAVAAAAATVAAVALEVKHGRPLAGAASTVLACLLAAHGTARSDPQANLRGPGRWLNVAEREALGTLPRPSGAVLDASTAWGRVLLMAMLAAWGYGVWMLVGDSARQAALVALDGVVLLAIFGTGKLSALPPDAAVQPVRVLRALIQQLRRTPGMGSSRLVPRIRIPSRAVDPDELRLLVAPRRPLRGFAGIEVGVVYATGFGASVALPEVLLRVVAGSPCDEAVAPLTRHGRITPGRKPEERVITFVPRWPTVRATREITVALAARVVDRAALSASGTQRPPQAAGSGGATSRAA